MNSIEVFIITYNRLSYFNLSLKSIIDQNINDLKITIIENGSNEANKIDTSFFGNNIFLVRHKENIPVYLIFEQIKEMITHEYLIVFHDDDLMHPLYLQFCNKILTKYSNKINLIATKFEPFFDNDKIEFSEIDNIENILCRSNTEFASLLYKGEYIHYGSVVYKSDIFKNKSLNFDKYGKICDRPFILECASNGLSIYIDSPLVKYRVHQSQDSTNIVNGPFINHLINLEKLYFNLLTKNFFSNNNLIFLKYCFRYLRDNYLFLRNNQLYDGSFFEYIKYSLRSKSINKNSLILGGLFYYYYTTFRLRVS